MSSNQSQTISVDVVIIGGGIAGLWTLTRLRQMGYDALLLEQSALGSEQTIASQGMIHGGIKYALNGVLSAESETIASMPAIWEQCLAGEGEIDLSQTSVLSRDFYLWSTGVLGKLNSFFASKALRGRVETLKKADYPAPLNHQKYKGQVYRLVDCVVDVPSLLENLLKLNEGAVFQVDWQQAQWRDDAQQITLNKDVTIRAKQFVFTAGKGNGALLDACGLKEPVMQLRPLRQIIVKHAYHDANIFGHCMGSQIQASPRLSISSHQTDDGQCVWYIGGDLATQYLDLNEAQHIAKAKKEIESIFSWMDFSDAQWSTISVDRAEPQQKNLVKPDAAFVFSSQEKSVVCAWPTKLTLAPDMAQKVVNALEEKNIKASQSKTNKVLTELLSVPSIAKTPW